MDFSNQMVPLIFTCAHFTFCSTSCVAPFNPYQSQHVVMFYNFPQQDTIIHLLSLGHRFITMTCCHRKKGGFKGLSALLTECLLDPWRPCPLDLSHTQSKTPGFLPQLRTYWLSQTHITLPTTDDCFAYTQDQSGPHNNIHPVFCIHADASKQNSTVSLQTRYILRKHKLFICQVSTSTIFPLLSSPSQISVQQLD
jgi:hypothetical protein